MERERKTHRVAQQLCTHCTIAATSPSSPFWPNVRGIDFLYAKSPLPFPSTLVVFGFRLWPTSRVCRNRRRRRGGNGFRGSAFHSRAKGRGGEGRSRRCCLMQVQTAVGRGKFGKLFNQLAESFNNTKVIINASAYFMFEFVASLFSPFLPCQAFSCPTYVSGEVA